MTLVRRLTPLFVATSVLLILALVFAAFGANQGAAWRDLYEGSIGSPYGLSRTLVKLTPLLLCALGITLAWRAGIFNIGGEGQFTVGALGGAWLATALVGTVPGVIGSPLILVASALFGSAYALIAGWLQVARNVPAVISTILLNFIAVQLQGWAVTGPLQETARKLPQTQQLPVDYRLLRLVEHYDTTVAVLLALVLAGLTSLWLFRTRFGLEARIVGSNSLAARAAGVSVSKTQLLALGLSGALCGLAGGIEFTSLTGMIGQGFAQGWGFLAIPAALLGGLHPIGVVGSSAIFASLLAGSENFSRFAAGGERLVFVVQALAVLGYVWATARKDGGSADHE